MERKTVSFHIPPIYVFVGVILSCLITGFFVDCIMQRYGCCGARGGCCRKESEVGVTTGGTAPGEGSRLTTRHGAADYPMQPV